MTLHTIEQKIQQGVYRSADEFTADFKWILHNCYVYFSTCYAPAADMDAVLKIAKSLLKTCKQEMGQIDTCAECYANANLKKNWFVEVCDPPHILLWAKLKGFPYWPAKGMAVNGTTVVDVRFFGAHDRAWVPVKDCYLYSQHNPNVYKVKNTTILACIKEIEQHIVRIRQKYGSFEYAPAKEKYDPLRHAEQLQLMVPSRPSVSDSVNVVADPPATKTNLTYKIIKTGDNSCLISPVVKGQDAATKGELVPYTIEKKKKTPPPPDEVSATSSSSPTTTREAIKPTKIVIKNAASDEGQKQYELVTPTPEERTEPVLVSDPDKAGHNGTGESLQKAVVGKKKSDKWRALSLKRKKIEPPAASPNSSTTTSQDVSPKRDGITTPAATNTPVVNIRDTKRRNTEEVSTTAAAVIPSKIRIRRVTRASSRPPAEVKDLSEGEIDETKEKVKRLPDDTEEKENERVIIATATDSNSTVEMVPKTLTTVRDVLDQLPQISIVPSRKNSMSKPENESRMSSRSSSKASTKESVSKKSTQSDLALSLTPETLRVKIEPISDDDMEITVNGRHAMPRERSVEIVDETQADNSKSTTSTAPRARKTFSRNVGNRPKPPAFNTAQQNNMVLIPRELNVDLTQSSTTSATTEATSANNRQPPGSTRQSPVHMLSGSVTQGLAAAVTNMISHGPPRLVRKPSGSLQSSGDVVFPSEAGLSCRILMENAHKMTDFFRSVIEDTLSDMADTGCLEARVQLLQLELEKQKYNHQKELAELKSNTGEWNGVKDIYFEVRRLIEDFFQT